MPSVFIKTLGCKVNTHDTAVLATQFKELGWDLVDDVRSADAAIVNTCSVTANADKESRYLLRRFRRENPEGIVVATGCYAQTDSARIAAMPEVNFVFPNEVKERLAAVVNESLTARDQGIPVPVGHLPEGQKPVKENRQGHFKTSLNLITADSDRTRAFLKIQDGCNGFCTYCLIPYARGQSRSVAPEKVVDEVRRLIERGVQEIVFTGIHIGDYGRDLEGAASEPFLALMRELFSWKDMVRLRISSLEPRELSEDFLILAKERSDIFCDHFHLPLQSGHDRILKMMRRSYDTAQYAEKVAMIRAYFPLANIGADVIPGFPGETEDEFVATQDFIEKTGLNYVHAFPYSKRPNTAAARMPGHLEPEIVKARTDALIKLGKRLKLDYQSRFLGKSVDVLWEDTTDKEGRRYGKTKNYLEVCATASASEILAAGMITPAKLKGFTAEEKILGIPFFDAAALH